MNRIVIGGTYSVPDYGDIHPGEPRAHSRPTHPDGQPRLRREMQGHYKYRAGNTRIDSRRFQPRCRSAALKAGIPLILLFLFKPAPGQIYTATVFAVQIDAVTGPGKFLIQLSRSRPCGSGAAQQRHRSTSDHRSRALLSNLDGLGLARSARYRSMAVSAPHAGIGTAKMLTGLSLLLFSGVINTNIAPVFADVFIGGAGPYRFLVDTASQTSLIDDVLANQLKLNPTYRVEIVTQKSTRLSPAAK